MTAISPAWSKFDQIYERPVLSRVVIVSGDISDKFLALKETKSLSSLIPVSEKTSGVFSRIKTFFSDFIYWVQGYTKVTCEVPVKANTMQTGFYEFYVKKAELRTAQDHRTLQAALTSFNGLGYARLSFSSGSTTLSDPKLPWFTDSSGSVSPCSEPRSPTWSEGSLSDLDASDESSSKHIIEKTRQMVERMCDEDYSSLMIFPSLFVAKQDLRKAQTKPDLEVSVVTAYQKRVDVLQNLYDRQQEFERFTARISLPENPGSRASI